MFMFKRIATLDIKQIYASDNKGKYYWRDLVKEANKILATDKNFLPKEAFEYDTKNFLYIKARAISGMEKWGPNGNGDAFPWEEIKKAYNTFPGKGYYIEHIEDSESDAKGIVLDAEPTDDEFLVCLCAIDKNEYPEICEKIISGELNQVSMSCLAAEAECSLCHNVAHSNKELCEHMNPENRMTYCKNTKDVDGNPIYEINRDIVFTGLSGVAVPADKDAFIFDIRASKNKKNALNDLMKDYFKSKIKYIQSSKMKEIKAEIEDLINDKTDKDVMTIVSSSLSEILKKLLSNECDHSQCNLPTFASILEDVARNKFLLEQAIERIRDKELQKQNEEAMKEQCLENKEETKQVFSREKLFSMLKNKKVQSKFWTKI